MKFSLVTRQNNRSNYYTFPKLCSFFLPKFESEMTASSNGRLIFLRHYANEGPIPQRGANFSLRPPPPPSATKNRLSFKSHYRCIQINQTDYFIDTLRPHGFAHSIHPRDLSKPLHVNMQISFVFKFIKLIFFFKLNLKAT